MNEDDKKLDHIEFESKYRVEPNILIPFGILVENLPTFREFIYATGPDFYFVNDGQFIRYRKESHKGVESRAELTMKIKPKGAKNNIIREEFNVRVDGTPKDAIIKFVTALGFNHNFTILKNCHIYKMTDATLVYYSVVDVTDGIPKNESYFVEIEVSEEQIHTMNEVQAWEILIKYEKAMESIGINARKRLKLSLFEMFYKE